MGVDEVGNCVVDRTPEISDDVLIDIITKRFWNDFLDGYCLFVINFFGRIDSLNEFPYNRPIIKRDIEKKIRDHQACREANAIQRQILEQNCKVCNINFAYTKHGAKQAAVSMLKKEFTRHVGNNMVELILD
jgi:hypothetical protein